MHGAEVKYCLRNQVVLKAIFVFSLDKILLSSFLDTVRLFKELEAPWKATVEPGHAVSVRFLRQSCARRASMA